MDFCVAIHSTRHGQESAVICRTLIDSIEEISILRQAGVPWRASGPGSDTVYDAAYGDRSNSNLSLVVECYARTAVALWSAFRDHPVRFRIFEAFWYRRRWTLGDEVCRLVLDRAAEPDSGNKGPISA